MGYIPLFLTVAAACLLFFLTVKNSMQRRLNKQRELCSQLGLAHPELGLVLGQVYNPDLIMDKWKQDKAGTKIPKSSLELIRQLKINRLQYNRLIKKAPYNWVAALGGFQQI